MGEVTIMVDNDVNSPADLVSHEHETPADATGVETEPSVPE
jgi:hypothetical protein